MLEQIAVHLRILIAAISLATIVVIVETIRRGRLREAYAIVWLVAGATILIFGVWPDVLDIVSRLLRLHHLTTLFMVAFLFLLAIVFHFSVVLSSLTERLKTLTQDYALLQARMEDRLRELDRPGRGETRAPSPRR